MVYFHSNAHISLPKQLNARTGPEHQEQQLCSPEAAGTRVRPSPGASQLSPAHACRTHAAPDTFRGSWVRPGRPPFSSVCSLGPAQRDSVFGLFFVKYL